MTERQDTSVRILWAEEFRFNLARGGDAAMVVAEMRAARTDALKDPEDYAAFVLTLAETALEDGVLYDVLRREALAVLNAQTGSGVTTSASTTAALSARLAAATPPPTQIETQRPSLLASILRTVARRKL